MLDRPGLGSLLLSLALVCSAPPLAAEPLDVELSGDASFSGPPLRISPDGGRVVFQTATEPRDVVSVPIEGGAAATLTPPDTEAVVLVDVAPDGSRVLMTAREPGSETEVYSAPLVGGEVVTLNHSLAPGVRAFAGPITPDGTRVIYGTRTGCFIDIRVVCPRELFVVPIDGGSPLPLEMPDLPLDGPFDGRQHFSVNPDSGTVVSVMFERLPEDVNEDPDPVALFSTPLAGGPATILHQGGWLNDPAFTTVAPFPFTPDGLRVVYIRTGEVGNPRVGELYSVTVAGGTPVKLNAPLASGQVNFRRFITPDGSRVVYGARQDRDVNEVYSVPTTGGPTTKLSHPDGTNDAFPWRMGPHGERVAFAQYVGPTSEHVLFSTPVQGGEPTRLSPPLAVPPGFPGIRAIQVSPDGTRVVYAAEQDTDDLADLYSVPIEGGPVTRLGGPLARRGADVPSVESRFRVTPDGTRVVFVTDSTDDLFDDRVSLYSVPIAGGVATKLSGPMEEGENIFTPQMEVSPDSRHVAFLVTRPRSFGTEPELHSARLPPEIRIDIEPRKHFNKLPRGRRAMVAVAIHGSDEVDATEIDLATLAFGPGGAPPERKAKIVDVDDDGFDDLVTRYRRNETGIEGGDAEACLSGSQDGFDFLSCDAIVTR